MPTANSDEAQAVPGGETETDSRSAAHSPLPWKRSCFLVTSKDGDWVTHAGMGNLPPSRSSESEANAAFIVQACNSHDALVEAVRFVKQFLNNLEDGTDAEDPLLALRQRTHAPLHAKLDAALELAKQRGNTSCQEKGLTSVENVSGGDARR